MKLALVPDTNNEQEELKHCVSALMEDKGAYESYKRCSTWIKKYLKRQIANTATEGETGNDSIVCGQHKLEFQWEYVPAEMTDPKPAREKKASLKISFEVVDK